MYLHVRVKDQEDFNILPSLYYSLDFIAEGMKKGSVFVYWSVCSFLLICVVAAVNRGRFRLWHVF